MKNSVKVMLVFLFLSILVAAGLILNAFRGNPISKSMASSAAKSYVSSQYGANYQMTAINYSLKNGGYYAHFEAPGSKDKHFSVSLDMKGNVQSDSFDNITDGFNTWTRLDSEYRTLCQPVLDTITASINSDIVYGEMPIESKADNIIYGLDTKALVVDATYDMKKLGADAGHIVFYALDSDCSPERGAEILLEIRKQFDAAGVPFKSIDLTVHGNNGVGAGDLNISNFLYDDIVKDGLTEKVKEAHDACNAWNESQNREK